MPALAVWTPEDGLLGAIAPLALAVAAGNALVVDLDEAGPAYPGDVSVAELVREGVPRRMLESRPGVAVLRNGGAPVAEAAAVVGALVSAHPTVVVRLPPRPEPSGGPLGGVIPVVPVRLLVPGGLFALFAPSGRPAVFQTTPAWVRMPQEGIRLPVPSPATVAALLVGRRPSGRDRWIAAWRKVWGYPWGR